MVGVANERVVPVNYLLDHVQFVVMVIRGGVATTTDSEAMVRAAREG